MMPEESAALPLLILLTNIPEISSANQKIQAVFGEKANKTT